MDVSRTSFGSLNMYLTSRVYWVKRFLENIKAFQQSFPKFFNICSTILKYKSSFIAIILFWLLFNFNGYIIAHLTIGHFQWTGYFLLSYFFLLSQKFSEDTQYTSTLNIKNTLAMAVLLGVLFLNGSFHIAIWCSIFMGICLLAQWRMYQHVIIAIVLGALIGLSRLIPAILFLETKEVLFGYPNIRAIVEAAIIIRPYDALSHYWEFDMFVGITALVLIFAGIWVAIRQHSNWYQFPIIIAAIALFMLSLGNTYTIISKLPIPLVMLERVPSRFIIMPFVYSFFCAMIGVDQLLAKGKIVLKLSLIGSIGLIAIDLLRHSALWRIKELNQPYMNIDQPFFDFQGTDDILYQSSILSSWFISIVILLFIMVWLLLQTVHSYRAKAI